MAIPTRAAFAISSASWTGQPAMKMRPCLVTGINENNGELVIAPFCGAHFDMKAKRWTTRPSMVSDHWVAVKFQGSGLAIPPQAQSAITKSPLKISTDPSKLTAGVSKFKPSYLWVADAGESVPLRIIQGLKEHPGFDTLSASTLENIRRLNAKVWSSPSRVPTSHPITLAPLE
ncbi:hypothetical protein HGRIS_012076 [Hohenbuehelia grisea]|uniref:Uncharacterized protein n=1 Tax=Hohenbuehelia grisea TaxID=104357 RepID=A0ABR3IR77_9AGAR